MNPRVDRDLYIIFEPLEWHLDAACRGEDPDLFFVERGKPTAAARAICATCPVQPDCLDYALRNPAATSFGIWAGTSERGRRRLRAEKGLTLRSGPPPQPIRHGTTGGYAAHRRRDEQACEACLEAERVFRRAREEAS